MIIKWFTPLQRVIKYSGRKPQMFYQGVLLRIAERILIYCLSLLLTYGLAISISI